MSFALAKVRYLPLILTTVVAIAGVSLFRLVPGQGQPVSEIAPQSRPETDQVRSRNPSIDI